MYNKLFTKVNSIENKILSTSGLVSRTQEDSEKNSLTKRLKLLMKNI